jgi:hypothetical protein
VSEGTSQLGWYNDDQRVIREGSNRSKVTRNKNCHLYGYSHKGFPRDIFLFSISKNTSYIRIWESNLAQKLAQDLRIALPIVKAIYVISLANVGLLPESMQIN